MSSLHSIQIDFKVKRMLVLQKIVFCIQTHHPVLTKHFTLIEIKTKKVIFLSYLNLVIFNEIDEFLITIESFFEFIDKHNH